MHLVYLNAVNPDGRLKDIQTHFSHIYRTVEQLTEVSSAPDEDALLAYHCAAYLPWRDEEWRKPKDLVKRIVREMPSGAGIADWVLSFSADLRSSFASAKEALDARDQIQSLAHLTIFGNVASFWPLLLKAYRFDKHPAKSSFDLVCRLMEVFAVRGYGFSVRSDAGLSSFYVHARHFCGDFQALLNFLHSASDWYDIQNRFATAIDRPSLYKTNKTATRYLLWRYENALRSIKGQAAQPLGWREYLHPVDDRTRLSIEHIAAQNNSIASTQVEWEVGQPLEDFSEVALNRLGNLVIDFQSGNSAKGKGDFSDKLESLETHSTFLSQGELKLWASRGDQHDLVWGISSVRQRHEHLRTFVLKTWSPSTYYTPTVTVPAPDDVD